jgi:hypothetical protein
MKALQAPAVRATNHRPWQRAVSQQVTGGPPSMRVIFLDIDGVLNCKRTPNPRKFPYIVDEKLLERFRGLVARADAAVVLSSTWRCDPAGLFSAKHWGIPFIDVLPDLPHLPAS